MKLDGDEFYIAGRGKLLTARLDEGEDPPSPFTHIVWKDVKYEIIGVESFKTAFGISRNVGLLVKEVKDGY